MSANFPISVVSKSEYLARERFFELALDMYCVFGRDGYFRLLNPAWTQTLGWSHGELQSRPWAEFVHPDDQLATITALQALAVGQTAKRIECRYQHKNGSYRWLWLNAFPMDDGDDIAAAARDITERKQTELREATRSSTLGALASGAALSDVLRILVRGVEIEHSGAISSVMLLDASGQFLQAGMAPSLPDFYNAATQHLPIGPAVGSCGTAAYTQRRVVTVDIQSDPAWATAKELAAKAGLASCCSQPIFDRHSRVVGTCALYRSYVHTPSDDEIATLEAAAQLASIAIERKNQEQALSDSESSYRRIVETTTEGIWTVDETAHVTFANAQLAAMLGYGLQEIVGKSLFDFIDEGTRERLKKRMELRRQGVSESYEYKFQHRDGHDVWTHVSASPLMNSSGKFSGAMAMVSDITERRAAAEELNAKRRLLESITATSPDVMYLYDPKTQRHLYINRDLKSLSGYDNTEFLSNGINLVLRNTHPDDLPRVTSHMRTMATMSSDEIVTLEYRNRAVTDEVRWMQLRERVYARDEQHLPTVIFGIVQDITDYKNAEEALRERENYLGKIINNIGDPVFVKDNQSKFVLVNDAFCVAFGLPRSDILGKTLSESLPQDRIQRVFEADRRVLDEGKDTTDEETVIRGGVTQTINSKKTRYIDDAGNRFLIGVIHDLSEHKHMEQALRSSEARLQGIFGAMAEGLVVQNLDGSIVECNLAAKSILGVSIDQLSGRKPMDSRRYTVHEDGAPFPAEHQPTMMVLRTGQAQRNVVMGVHRSDDTFIWISINAVPLHDSDQKMIGAVASFSDITSSVLAKESLKHSEASLAAAQSQAKIGSWELHLGSLKVSWSAELYRIFGRSPALGVPSQQEFTAMIHPDDRETYAREFARAVAENISMHMEFRIVLADSTMRWLEIRGETVINEYGQPTVMMGTTQDITERHQLEAQFRQAQKMEAIGTLAGGIAHDFNNILAAVNGYTQLARADIKDRPDVHEHLDAVLQGTLRATELVKQITTFSRQHEAQRTPLQLHAIVGEALALIRASIPAAIKITSKLNPSTPAILADATQVHQIVMNLCTNAWHAMKAKSGCLEVCVEEAMVDAAFAKSNADLQPGSYVRLSVEDTGIGMNQGTMARIFEPFFTTKPPGEGSGLGLAVAHGIMRSHHGAIIVNSIPNVGSKFDLYFPVFTGAIAKAKTSIDPKSPQGSGEKIVLVDDEPALIRLTTRILERLGYTVNSFVSSEAAMAALKSAPDDIDLLITDLSMPVISGLDLVKELRQLRPNLPIIVVSGHADALAQQQINALGVQYLLSKPYSLESLGIAVHQLLTSKEKE